MKTKILPEPRLEFGNGVHVCPKAGIETLGVYDTHDNLRQSELRLGIVGRGEGIDLIDMWLNRCQSGFDGKKSKYPNLFRNFSGFSLEHSFFTKLLYGSSLTRTIQRTQLSKILKLESQKERVKICAELYFDQIRFIVENRSVDVVLCVIPDDIFESLTQELPQQPIESDEKQNKSQELEHNFRRLLKAKSMHLRVPLQLIVEDNLSIGKSSKNKQDDASRAWNFCTALYYKGNRTIPWRLVEEFHKPKTCYVGVGFYKSRDRNTISTSLTQLFDEFGHGVILRGTPVSTDKNDRRPFMNEQQAYDLLSAALDEYDHALMQMPARIVIHKTSNFKQSEIDGFSSALSDRNIRSKDFVTILNSTIRLFGYKHYPPPRGTLLTLNENKGILYTRGLVDFYKTYPGMYVPNPLDIRLYEHDSSLEDIAEEILGLTKMNWNNTQLDGKFPITLECAKRVGDIMKYVDINERPQVSYRFYM